jgi:pterin-4a-carbinolamine dehydratase
MEWTVANNRLTAEIVFESQTELAELFFMIARKADEMGHHPDIFVSKAYTDKDHELARLIAEMVE